MFDGFTKHTLAEGIHLHVMPTKKFKTNLVYVYLHLPLEPVQVTRNALLPMVMVRASEEHPSTADLSRHLDELYGTSLSFDVSRRGEVQSLVFRLEVAGEQHIPGESGLLRRGLETLAGVLLRPATQGGGFRPDYFEQEATNLRQTIESLINDKRRYALVRCTEEMCQGEPFALYRLGQVRDLDQISPESLLAHHAQVVSSAPVDIFMVGDVDPHEAHRLVTETLLFPAAPGPRRLPKTLVKREAGHPPRRLVDRLNVNQGVLVVGFRTGATVLDEAGYFPLLVANGVFGGFSHSKLFQEVRERHSLAYYAYSMVESMKGVGFVYAGIEFENKARCEQIILEQLKAVQDGAITDEELQTTVHTLVNDILAAADNPGALADLAVDGVFTGRPYSTEDRVHGYRSVTREQVAAAARKFSLDTIYFLDRTGGE